MDYSGETARHTLIGALLDLYLSLDRIYAAASRDVDLTPQQAELLCRVEHDRPALGELAGALGCDKTNVTGLVDRATKRGLVERAADERDRRVTRIEITNDGRRLLADFHERLGDRLAGLELDDGIKPEAINAIVHQLARAGDNPNPEPPTD